MFLDTIRPLKEMTMPRLPAPGSDSAIKIGCKCPVLDNAHGQGHGGQPGMFVSNGTCPIHDVEPEEASKFIRKLAMKRIGL